jgi:hypothetical protein
MGFAELGVRLDSRKPHAKRHNAAHDRSRLWPTAFDWLGAASRKFGESFDG